MIRKYPLAAASLILGVVSFIQLFGLEKALLAVIFGGIALKALPAEQAQGKKYAYAGIILGSLYVLTLFVLMLVKGPELLGLIGKMK